MNSAVDYPQNGKALFGSHQQTKFLIFTDKRPSDVAHGQSIAASIGSNFENVQSIVIPSTEKRALQYFGVKKEKIPSYLILHVEQQGLQIFKEHLFDETCMPFCKVMTHEGQGTDAAVRSFVSTSMG